MNSEQEKKISKSAFKEDGMFNGANRFVFELAKDLRKNMTDAERVLWNHVKTGIKGHKMRRQHPISIYIADFYCHPVKLIIEVDGKIHDNIDVKLYDDERHKNLEAWGYCVIRFTNEEVMKELDKVLLTIESTVGALETKFNHNSETQSPPEGRI